MNDQLQNKLREIFCEWQKDLQGAKTALFTCKSITYTEYIRRINSLKDKTARAAKGV